MDAFLVKIFAAALTFSQIAAAPPEFKTRFTAFGVDPAPLGPAEFGDYIRHETEKWTRDIKQAGIEPE